METPVACPREQFIHQLFEAQAERTPDATAIVYEGEELTYAELNRRANRLAHRLRRLGVGPERLVAVCLERSTQLVAGLLGILKAGAAYVPLDPAYPSERLAFMLGDCRAPVLLTERRVLESLPAHDARIMRVDADANAFDEEPEHNPQVEVTGDNLAYVIYTSGSTGRPKGAMNTHAAVLNRLLWMQDAYRLDSTDSVLQKTPFSFDVSVWEFFWPLMFGARLVVARPLGHHDNAYLADVIAREKITTLHFVPSMLRVFLEEPDLRERCASLRRVVCSGEALSFDLQELFFARLDAELHNLYGPTEAAVDVTAWRCERESERKVVPIGWPTANVQVYLLDEQLRPVVAGEDGELHIGGVQLARGYLNRPALTAEKFVPDPLSTEPGARLYKTGDVARHLPDGAIEYAGRIDHQVKICGVRIEAGEIEAAVVEHGAVRACAVLAREDAPGDKRLVAYLVSAAGADAPSDAELRAFLQARLPHYMIPSAFVWMERLPLTPNGKLDRKALPTPVEAALSGRETERPRTPVEELIAGVWCEVLGRREVGVHDDFFELGGHSLLAAMLVSRLRRSLQTDLSVPDVFDSPTIARLAAKAEARRRGESSDGDELRRVERGAALPLSYAQQRLLFLHRLKPESAFYNLPLVLRLCGPLDVAALKGSFDEIARRHEILSARFIEVEGEPVQVTGETRSPEIFVVDAGGHDAQARMSAAETIVREAARAPFDLTKPPLWRVVLVRLSDAEHLLAVVMHHIISDGWSMGVLARELTALYSALREGRPSPLAELPVQYADFAVWQRERQARDAAEEQLEYWQKQLEGSQTILQLPTDRPRPLMESYRGATYRAALPAPLVESLRAFSRRESSTLFMTLLAAFNVLLGRYTGQTDINVGTPAAGRNRAEVEGLIGFFVNTLVIRTDLAGDPRFSELLKRVRETTLAAYARQDVPFERLVERLHVERSLSHAPLFQVAFAFNNMPSQTPQLDGLETSLLEVDTATAKFDLALTIEDDGSELTLAVEYSTDLFDGATIRRLTSHFQTLLTAIAADPEARISELPLLTAAETDEIIFGWNQTLESYPRDACVHELFEAQAARTPHLIALTCEDRSLTFAELNRRANQLAHRLRRLGVGPETLVAVCLERSIELIAAQLGILKAGAAYVSLDPTYPSERLAFMLTEADAPVLLTESCLLDVLLQHRGHTLCVEADWARFQDEDEENLSPSALPHNLAYVIHTSGSTGRPKGVAIEHAALVNLCRWHVDEYAVDTATRASQVAGQSFDASVWEVWPYLLAGASVNIADHGTILSPPRLWRWLADRGITHCFLPTALAESLLPLAESEAASLKDAAAMSLRYLFAGGDKLHRRPSRELPFRLVNLYGPTENTIISTAAEVGFAPRAEAIAPPIGGPIANTQAYVLDEHLRPVPVGVAGELYVGGCGLARGYLRRPALTAERFIPNPFAHRRGEKGQAEMSEATEKSAELSPEDRAALVMRLRLSADEAGRETIPRHRGAGPFPLSFAQQRLWFLDQLEPNSPYIIPANFHLKGRLDRDALERTLNEIVLRHESLRTTFASIDGQPMQLVAPHLTLSLPSYDLSGLAGEARELEVKRLKLELGRPFNLTQPPLVRAALVRLGAEEHLLLMTMHHIISDGWSIGVMVSEMAALYEAFTTGREAALPALPIQYKDFAVWQREWLSGAELEQQLAYWRERLRGAPPALELPTDRPRPPVQSYRGSMRECVVGSELLHGLKELSRREGVTPYMTLLAAFLTLLYRHSGQEDLVVGTPIANRNRVEIENLIGFFVNTLVLRTDLSKDPPFRLLLQRVRHVTLGAYAHQDLPFEKLVEELQPERDTSRTPLFQVMFSLQNAPLPSVNLGDLSMRLQDDETRTAQFDLTLDLMERDDSLLCSLEYNTDLFDTETAERMLRHYVRLLESVVSDADCRLSELPMLGEDERHQLLVEWNDAGHNRTHVVCVQELFEQQAAARETEIAVTHGGLSLTYGELNRRANQLAHRLRRLGVGPESRVAVLLERSIEIGLAMLGVLKAGGAYVMLDPTYPPERLRQMLDDAEATVLVTAGGRAAALPELRAQVVNLDEDLPLIARESEENPPRVARTENLAYVVYTSGTTGKPKGILIPHGALANAIFGFIAHHQVTERDRVLQFASPSFDVATEEFFAAWLSGARLVMWPSPVVSSPAEFVRFLDGEAVTLVNLPASFWAEWAAVVSEPGCGVPATLRRVIVGNEKTLPASLERWRSVVGDRAAWNNAYGPSETTITASNYEPRTGTERPGASAVPIGRPIMNVRMYVLDKARGPVSVGVPGELYIGGAGVARGYQGEPGRTAERFVPDPHVLTCGERMYRTGDLARYLPDGNIEFLGRADDQVKVRGFRIEPGEVETVLGQHPGVREAAVVARADGHGGNRLIAYFAGSAEAGATVGELRRYLKERLPEYMVPSAFVALDALPLTPNGKIDRRRLPELDASRPELEEVYTAPRTELERSIAGVWQEVLKVERVGVHDNFFNLGGHSLLIMQVNSRTREVLQTDVSILDMFKYPTVSALAEFLSRETREAEATSAPRTSAETRIEAMNRQRQLRQRQQSRRRQQRETADE
jgi:amino acid adenylation domain-containing protein